MGLFDRLKRTLTRTRSTLSDRLTGLLRGGRPIDAALLAELEELLYTSDLGPVAAAACAELARLSVRGEIKTEEDVRARLRESLLARLDPPAGELALAARPTVVMIVGVNGSGKTTSIAKLARRYTAAGKRVVVGACDTFRAGAIEQLRVWAERGGAVFVGGRAGGDPASAAFESVDLAAKSGADLVLLDTAGRLHTQKNLMDELHKVKRVVSKRLPGAPHEVLLVLDATNGQNAIQQAREFTGSAGVTGLIVTKLDGTARGGALFTIQKALGVPVRYVGTGETLDDLDLFEPQAFVDAIVSSAATATA